MDWSVDSPAFLATVQKVFNLSFPNIDVTLSVNDKITNTVCQTDSQLVWTSEINSKSGLSKDEEPKVIAGQRNSRFNQAIFWRCRVCWKARENPWLRSLGIATRWASVLRCTNATGMQGETRWLKLHCLCLALLSWHDCWQIVYYSIPKLSWDLSLSSRLPKSIWPLLDSPSSHRPLIKNTRQRVYMLWF